MVVSVNCQRATEEGETPCDRHRNGGSDRGRDVPRVTQLVGDTPGAVGPQIVFCLLHGMASLGYSGANSFFITYRGCGYLWKPTDMLLPTLAFHMALSTVQCDPRGTWGLGFNLGPA